MIDLNDARCQGPESARTCQQQQASSGQLRKEHGERGVPRACASGALTLVTPCNTSSQTAALMVGVLLRRAAGTVSEAQEALTWLS